MTDYHKQSDPVLTWEERAREVFSRQNGQETAIYPHAHYQGTCHSCQRGYYGRTMRCMACGYRPENEGGEGTGPKELDRNGD